MRQKIVAGNWKMNTNLKEGIDLTNNILNKYTENDIQLIIFPPFTHLNQTCNILKNNPIYTGAQNCAFENKGAYTGEISAEMIKSAGASHVLIGHSERRNYFNEKDNELLKKLKIAIEAELIPVFCCGELLADREAGNYFDTVENQLNNTLLKLDISEFKKCIIAYEPVWAIGTGKTASPGQAQEMHAFIRNLIKNNFGEQHADTTPILYGGSCKPGNAKSLFKNPDVDGGLIGGASLNADDFLEISKSF